MTKFFGLIAFLLGSAAALSDSAIAQEEGPQPILIGSGCLRDGESSYVDRVSACQKYMATIPVETINAICLKPQERIPLLVANEELKRRGKRDCRSSIIHDDPHPVAERGSVQISDLSKSGCMRDGETGYSERVAACEVFMSKATVQTLQEICLNPIERIPLLVANQELQKLGEKDCRVLQMERRPGGQGSR